MFNKSGFTLVECLCVIFVIALLIGIFLPAVNNAREASRRMVCANNLRQLGLALSSYTSVGNTYPQPGKGPFSVHSLILPFIEQGNLYDAINFKTSPDILVFNENTTVARTSINVFLCPSNFVGVSHRSDYPGNIGRGVEKYGYDGSFVLVGEPPVTLAGFRDGTSHTIALSEWVATSVFSEESRPPAAVFKTDNAYLGPNNYDLFYHACVGPDAIFGNVGKGYNWLRGGPGATFYNHVVGINGRSCTNRTLVREGAWSAGSFHSGGANSLFADGHVSYLTDTMQLSVWRAVGSRNGGDFLPGNFD